VVAALSLYLGYRARTAPYRERLYERRLDAYGEIVRTLGELHDEVQVVLRKGETGPLDVTTFRLRTRKPAEAFLQSYRLWRVFLTRRINGPITDYVETFGDLASNSPAEADARSQLDGAFERVAEAANNELGVDVLSLETSALFGRDEPVVPFQSPSSGSVVAVGVHLREVFEGFYPENEGALRPGTNVEPSPDLREERDRAYARNRNLFMIHAWRPSERPDQVADISIRLEEHARRRGPSNPERPLRDSLVERVEYHVGRSWFEGGSVVKTNAEDRFRLDISAYGSTLCVARVHFRDGGVVVLQRYLDFPHVRTSRRRGGG
jgi:hypothetical protein